MLLPGFTACSAGGTPLRIQSQAQANPGRVQLAGPGSLIMHERERYMCRSPCTPRAPQHLLWGFRPSSRLSWMPCPGSCLSAWMLVGLALMLGEPLAWHPQPDSKMGCCWFKTNAA